MLQSCDSCNSLISFGWLCGCSGASVNRDLSRGFSCSIFPCSSIDLARGWCSFPVNPNRLFCVRSDSLSAANISYHLNVQTVTLPSIPAVRMISSGEWSKPLPLYILRLVICTLLLMSSVNCLIKAGFWTLVVVCCNFFLTHETSSNAYRYYRKAMF